MKTYLRIISNGKNLFNLIIYALIFLIFYNLFSAASLTLIIPFLEILFSNQASTLIAPTQPLDLLSVTSIKTHSFHFLNTQIIEHSKLTVLFYFCLIVGISILFKSIFRYLSAYCITPVEQGIIQNIRNKIFNHLTILPLSFYTKQKRGYINTIVLNDVALVQDGIIGTIISLISDPITMILFMLTMLFISWKLTLFTFIILPLTGFVISKIAKSLKRRSQVGQHKLEQLAAILDEFIGGYRIVKSFTAELFLQQKYQHLNNDYTKISTGIRRRISIASPVTEILSITVILIIIYYGGYLIITQSDDLKPSEFIGFIAIFSQFIAPIKTITDVLSRVQKAIVSYARIEELLSIIPSISENKNGKIITTFDKEIEFKNVFFSYNNNEPVLQNISFKITKGQTVALVGKSGSGKSTIADLLSRFYEPTSGEILIDGINLKEYNTASLRKLIGVVTQEPILFNDSIQNNIAFAQKIINMEAIKNAAKVANATEFIEQIPTQFQTQIGERGTRLSGGQRQRIAIARAIYHNPPILILDEATSALDTHSERQVQQALNQLIHNHTSLIIAHRLSTITNAHQIIVLNEGKIIEKGSHQELLSLNKYYKKLYDLQFQEA